MLSNIRHYIDIKTSKSIHHAIFESHLYSVLLVWAQNLSFVKILNIQQKKSLRLMFFQNRNAHTGLLFKNLEILKFSDKVDFKNCILIVNLFTNPYQKSFVTGLLYLLNLPDIIPDGQTMIV